MAGGFDMKTIKIEVNGKMYTYKQLSEISGLSMQALYYRYKKGLRDDELISKARIVSEPKKYDEQMGRKKQLVFGRILSLSAIAEAYNIKNEIVYERYNSGLRGEDIVYPPEPDWKDTVRELWKGKWKLTAPATITKDTGYRWNAKQKWVWKGVNR